MAYFIHNKYDSNSSAKVTHVSGTSYTYKEDPGVTVIDFFGNMEAGVNTYRNLDTTYMGIKPVDELTYTCLLYTSPSPRDISGSRMPSSA